MVQFTQYLPPRGQKKPVSIEMPEAVEAKAAQIIAAGFTFEIETLSTGEVSMTITHDDGDVAIRVCKNGPDVPKNVQDMIEKFRIPEGGGR